MTAAPVPLGGQPAEVEAQRMDYPWGSVSVGLQQDGRECLRITVDDDGAGAPERVWAAIAASLDPDVGSAERIDLPVAARTIEGRTPGQQHRDQLDKLGEETQDAEDTDPA